MRWHERSPDVAILGADNTSVHRQQINLARAFQDEGLDFQFLAEDLSAPPGRMADSYRASGFETEDLPSKTWRSGPLAYPSTPGQLRLLLHWGRTLKNYKPKLVLTHSDRGGTWGALQAWAKQRAVTGVVLQEGISAVRRPGYSPAPSNAVRRIASLALRTLGPSAIDQRREIYEYADHALVWGDAMKRSLESRGRAAAGIHVVGNPGFDHIRRRAPLAPQERRTVLFAHQPQPNADQELAASLHLIRTCTQELGCRLLFRPHPRGGLQGATVREMAAAMPAPELVEVADAGEISNYFDRASVLVTYYSSVAYEACIAGLPIVLLDWVSPLYELDAPEFGAALSAHAPPELGATLGRALDDAPCRGSLYAGGAGWLLEHLGPLDGGASRRAAEVIRDLVLRKRHGMGSEGREGVEYSTMVKR